MKIIYIFERRHCYEFDEKMFQFESFTKRGIEIECWSAVNWTFQNSEYPFNANKEDYCHYINNEDELCHELNRLKKQKCFFLIFPYHAYGEISYRIRKHISNSSFLFFNITETPDLEGQKTSDPSLFEVIYIELKKAFNILAMLTKGTLKKSEKRDGQSIKNLFFSYWGPFLYKSKYNFITVPQMYRKFPNIYEKYSRRNILVHSNSYDDYIRVKEKKRILKEKYIVFVDQAWFGHDFFKNQYGIEPITRKEDYFSCLDRLFIVIENYYNNKVIIAAHPKSTLVKDEYKGRQVIYYRTAELIKDSEFVIVMNSTCFGLITMFKKKFLQIYYEEMFINIPDFKIFYNSINRYFFNKIIDISKENDIEDIVSAINCYDKNNYDKYKHEMIIASFEENNNELFYDVVAKKICQIAIENGRG